MSLPNAWARLPGPADFLDTITDDLADRSAVLVGLPDGIPGDAVAEEVAELVTHRGLGRWEPIRGSEARSVAPIDSVARRFTGGNARGSVLWVDITGDGESPGTWPDYALRQAEVPDMARICIVMDSARAESCHEDKRLRRRLWRDFVTPLDARALAERLGRRFGYRTAHLALRSAVVAELAGTDLGFAEQLSRVPLGRILQARDSPRDRIWAAQVSVLFPLVERERQRLIDSYRTIWRVPHSRQDGTQIRCLNDLEVGDMAAQARVVASLEGERQRLDWLRRVRNALAHNEMVPWGTLVSPIGVQIADFR